MKFPFVDLKTQYQKIKDEVGSSILSVLEHGQYINGPEVRELEKCLSDYTSARHVITCGNGTDALVLVLMALGIKKQDVVFVPSFTFVATAEAVVLAGGTPFFVDVDPIHFNLNPSHLLEAISEARRLGYTPKGVIPVDLFGHPACHDQIRMVTHEEKLWSIDDAAQAFGASYKGRKLGKEGIATTTSFYPAKPLGCYGDGGAIFTDDDALAQRLRSLRDHGNNLLDRYDHDRVGMNSRLDSIQAAILLEKLKIFEGEVSKRALVALKYTDFLKDYVSTPKVSKESKTTWAQYTIQTRPDVVQKIISAFEKESIPYSRFYSKPLHTQNVYKEFPRASDQLRVTEKLSQSVISLPMGPYLLKKHQDFIIDVIQQVCQTQCADWLDASIEKEEALFS
jgi:dTDP-4-amino-4,6-dideoxygalactose transaminase